MKRCKFQLYELGAMVGGGKAIDASGGVVKVCAADAQAKLALTDADGASLANPRALTNGSCEFYVADSVSSIDLFIACPGGQFLVVEGVAPEQIDDLYVDVSQRDQVMVIPFDIADFPATVETDSGFDEPTNAVFKSDAAGAGMRITAIDASETLDVGTATADSGDPNGFIAAGELDNLGIKLGDQGALLTTLVGHISGGKSIALTTTAGSDTGKGYVFLPYVLLN